MSVLLRVLAIVMMGWAAFLGFGFTDNPDLLDDVAGWLCAGLAFWCVSTLPVAQRSLR